MNKVKYIFNIRGSKQTWLAEQLWKRFDMVNSCAHNRRQPSIETRCRIASILNVGADELLCLKEDVERVTNNHKQ